jgi:thymidine kinase
MAITTYVGPMFAGKTSSLLNEITRHRIAKRNVLVFKPAVDVRYSKTEIVTHTGEKVSCYRTSDLKTIQELIDMELPQVIVFDEVQFYEKELQVLVQTNSMNNIQVICGGLDMDFCGRPFQTSALIMGVSNDVIKLKAVCVECGADATMTFHTQPTLATIDIGGTDKYQARCVSCWQNQS